MPTQFTHGIRFEVAQDVRGALIAHWTEAAAKVRDAADPDASRLSTIQAEQRKLRILRDELDPDDAAQIEAVIAEHAPLAQLKPDGSLDAVFLYGDRPNVPELMVRAGVTYRLLTDHLGSVRLVLRTDTTTPQDLVAQRIDYDPWGLVSVH